MKWRAAATALPIASTGSTTQCHTKRSRINASGTGKKNSSYEGPEGVRWQSRNQSQADVDTTTHTTQMIVIRFAKRVRGLLATVLP
jgi:hypothetical protein